MNDVFDNVLYHHQLGDSLEMDLTIAALKSWSRSRSRSSRLDAREPPEEMVNEEEDEGALGHSPAPGVLGLGHSAHSY